MDQAPKPSPTGEPHDMAQRAATARKSEARAHRCSTTGSTKTLAPSNLTEQDKQIRLGDECACDIRLVDPLDIESYNRFVDGVSELTLRDKHKSLFSSSSKE